MKLRFIHMGLVALTFLNGLSCGPGDPGDGMPLPGTMEVVAISPVNAADAEGAENLFGNGDFRVWWAGAPVPQEFQMPGDAFSSLIREAGAGESSFAARQVWQEDDSKQGLDALFSVEAEVEAGVTYTLQIMAEKKGGRPTSVWIFEFDEQGRPAAVDSPFIQFGPSEDLCKMYVRTFTPKRSGPVVIASRAEGPAQVLWYEWRLTRNG